MPRSSYTVARNSIYWIFPTATERLAAVPAKTEETRIAWQLSDDTFWVLKSYSPAVWVKAHLYFSDALYPPEKRINNPAHLTNLEEVLEHNWSAGVIQGATVTDNTDGTVAVTASEVLLRSSAVEDAALYLCSIAAVPSVSLTDNTINYLYADYNGGSPVLAVTTALTGFNCLDKCVIAAISRESTHLHIVEATRQNVDANRKLRRRYLETEPFKVVPGGTSLGTSGLYVTLTAGKFWFGLEPLSHSAVDTSQVGTGYDREYSTYYRNGSGGWTKATGVKQLDTVYYDDNSGTLATIGNNKYGVHWLFLALGTNTHMAMVYGQGSYNTVADAQAATAPSTLPPVFAATSVLVGRVIFQKSATSVLLVESAFTQQFGTTSVDNHNNLAGLQGGISGEYYHLTSAQATELIRLRTVHATGYKWAEWSPSDLVGTPTQASGSGSGLAANDYLSVANAGGAVTLTFLIAGTYLVTFTDQTHHLNVYDFCRVTTVVTGTATRYLTNSTLVDVGQDPIDNDTTMSVAFIVTATANNTVIFTPSLELYAATGTTSQHLASCTCSAIYAGS